MHYTFVCPGMPFNGDFIERGRSLGGSETAAYYLAREIAALGHRVIMFTNDREAGGAHHGVDYGWVGPPSARYPLGEYVHALMESTYIDALVLQRAAGIHHVPHAAKVALWWLHDLALQRAIPDVRKDSFQYDGILTVSDWHRNQVSETWSVSKEHVHVIPNSVDHSLYESDIPLPVKGEELTLLYQSRPERGVDYLLSPGGIMDQLAVRRPEARLLMCGYDNYPDHMREYYDQVYSRARSMKNVEVLGHLGKADLAQLQRACDVMVYPGEFEETSCITALEAQAAGLPMVASRVGALPETCGEGTRLIPLKDGRCNADAFVEFLHRVSRKDLARMSAAQSHNAKKMSWANSARRLDALVSEIIAKTQENKFSMVRSMLDRSDVLLAKRYLLSGDGPKPSDVSEEIEELTTQFQFLQDPKARYDGDVAVSELDKDKNLDVTGTLRFQETMRHLFNTEPKPVAILDYGCQKGHYIWSMASLEKSPRYVGIDISPRVVEWARENCKMEGASIEFYAGGSTDYHEILPPREFDGLVLGEVLEHVEDPVKMCKDLEGLLVDGCRVVITTPFGDWEGKDFKHHAAQRYHLHHFERADLDDLFHHHADYLTTCVPAGRSEREPLGSWVTTFTWRSGTEMANSAGVNWERKMAQFVPRQTLSYCGIVRNAESTLLRSLLTLREVADEFIIAVDKTTSDSTRAILEDFRTKHAGHRRFVVIDAESPLDIGFDEARNRTVERARGDWILWADSDEDLIYPERLIKYLRNNQYDGYAIAQHHLSADPVGVLTTDWPVRVFRNLPYLRFKGVVHEHPDDAEHPNSGPRAPAQLVDMHIMHHGYTTEAVRRARFQRNLPLIQRDRRENPDRLLGRMLWMRDLAHLCMFEIERTQGRVNGEVHAFAEEGIREWELLLKEGEKQPIAGRMVRDGLEFYTTLVSVLGLGFDVQLQMHAARPGTPGGARLETGQRRGGRFLNREHLDKYLKICVDEQVLGFDSKYF